MSACHEIICQAVCARSRGRVTRRPRPATDERRAWFRDPMVMTGERPAEAGDRAVPGHWEGDPITGAANRSATGTPVERTTRLAIPPHLPDGHGAEQARDAII